MTNNMYMQFDFIISVFRNKKSFTSQDVADATGYADVTARAKIAEMVRMEIIHKLPKVLNKGIYVIDPMANEKLESWRGMGRFAFEPDDDVFDKYPKLNFTGGKVVKKANVKGMGSAFLKRFDSLLREVRCGMPTMQ